MSIDVFKLSCREFFFGYFKTQDFFCLWTIFKKNRFFGQIFEILQGAMKTVLATPYEELKRLFFGRYKLSVFKETILFG